jgi:hypothetical protein
MEFVGRNAGWKLQKDVAGGEKISASPPRGALAAEGEYGTISEAEDGGFTAPSLNGMA